MGTLILLGLGLVVLIGANWVGSYFYPGGYLFAQEASAQSYTILPIVLLAVAMLVGIVSSFIFERAKSPQAQRTTLGKNMKKALTDFRLIAAVFVSPVIFNSVYALVGQAPDSMSDYLLAYQNGFFWQTILSGLASKVGPSA
jgi:hypothetical protein